MPGFQSLAQRALAQPPKRYADGGLVDDTLASMERQRLSRRSAGASQAAQDAAWSQGEGDRVAQQLMAQPPENYADGGAVGFGARGLAGLRDMVPKMAAMGYPQAAAPAPATAAMAAPPRSPAGLRAVIPQVEAMGYQQASAPAPQYFAEGGLVDPARRPNSFGDAAAAAADPSVTQVRTSAADTFGRAAPSPAPAPAGLPSAAARMASTSDPTNPYAASNANVLSNFASQQGSRGVLEMGRAPAPAPLTARNSFGDAAAATVDPSVTQPRYTPGAPAPAPTQVATAPAAPAAPVGLAASARLASPALATPAPPAPMGWAERQAQRNADVSAASITNRPEWSRAPLAQQRLGQMPNAPAGLQPRRFADGGLVQDEQRRRYEIPGGGQPTPPADGSQNNIFDNEIGRNVLNTLSALPGVGTVARAGSMAARGGAAATRAGTALSAERAAPATWELVEGGGALASRASAPAAQQMAQLPGAGGPLARAANMAPQQPAPALAGPGGQLAPAGAGQAARGAMEFVERVPDAAIGMSQAAAPAGLAARAGAGGAGRYATGAAGLAGAAMLAGATPDTGAAPTQPAGFAPGTPVASAQAPTSAAAAMSQPPGAAPAGITRTGNSYTGPANISGDVTINGAAPGGGAISARNMAAADALAGRQAQESAARVMAQMPAGFPAAVQAPTVLHSGNDWQSRNDLRNALVSASSITADGGRFDRNKGESPESLAYRALLSNDMAARGAVPRLAGEAMALTSANNREAMRERSAAAQAAANRENDLTRTLITERGNNSRAAIAADATTEAARTKAAAAGQKPATEAERTAAGYAQRMIEATKYIDKFEDTGKASYTSEGARAIPKIGGVAARAVMSKEQEQYRQGQEDWVRAKLRKESGAVIGDQEMQREIETYFPMPGESPEVIQQKKAARAVAIDAMRTNAGTALPERYNQPAAPAPAPAADTSPQIAELQRRAANNPALAARLKELGY